MPESTFTFGVTGNTGESGGTGSIGKAFSINRYYISFDNSDIEYIQNNFYNFAVEIYIITVLYDRRNPLTFPESISGDKSKHVLVYDGVQWSDWGQFIGNTGESGDTGGSGGTGETSGTGATGHTGGSGGTGSTGATGHTGGSGGTGETSGTGHTGGSGNTGGSGGTGETSGTGATGDTGGSGRSGGTGETSGTGATGDTGDTGHTGGSGGTGETSGTGHTGHTGGSGGSGGTGETSGTGETGGSGGSGGTGETSGTGHTGGSGGTGNTGETGGSGGTGSSHENGFDSRITSLLSVSGRIFSIAPSNGSYNIFTHGTKIIKTQTDSIEFSNDITLHYFYFDPSGILRTNTSGWSLLEDIIPISTIYWNGNTFALSDERHSNTRDRHWHTWAHNTIGARYGYGLNGVFTNTSLLIIDGAIYDEDIKVQITSKTNCLIWYRTSSANNMTFNSSLSNIPYLVNGNNLVYDNNGILTDCPVNQYVVSWIYATNDINNPIYCVLGQETYNNLSKAQTASLPLIPISTAEWKLLYRVIYKNISGVPTYTEAYDYRSVSSGPPTVLTSISNPLASNVYTITDEFNNILSSSDTTVQTALNKLDKHTHEFSDIVNINDNIKHGRSLLSFGDTSKNIVFESQFLDSNYSAIVTMSNPTDPIPSIYSWLITTKNSSSFNVVFSGPIDSNNFTLEWIAKKD